MTRLCYLRTGILLTCVLFGVGRAQDVGHPQSQPGNSRPKNSLPDSAPREEPLATGHPTFVSPHARPIVLAGDWVFVVNTPADTVDVIDRKTCQVKSRIKVGIDPVSLAVRPDGRELWVSNHISDSVSVIDLRKTSPTFLHVIATIQQFDRRSKATKFDEPLGIAFAGNEKAYVALSSANEIAVIDVKSRKVCKRLTIPAQEPRAIFVRNNRLYVIPFESNNKTQLSGGSKIDGDLVTFNAWDHSIRVNNVLSLGHVVDIVKHPEVPDRDLFVFDTRTDEPLETVDTLGTLLYGLTVDSRGRVFIAQTDARNDANGRSGTKKHGLAELENRAFLNRITKVTPTDGKLTKATFFDLEPLPPQQPQPAQALATPFAVQISEDDSTLFASAAGSNVLFTLNADTGDFLGRVSVGAVPRGIALESAADGSTATAWVFNAVANSVSVVDASNPTELKSLATVELEDPTHPQVKRGRAWFNDARASTTGTFSCASCHPDGHTDQLLWVLKTPIVSGGNQIMPRSTMPIRGLRDTEPYHWDGIPGDPYGGNNSANIHGSSPPNSRLGDPVSSVRHLIDGGLATTMHQDGDKSTNDAGQIGKLSASQRDDMAHFLLSVPYPPAPARAYDNVLSDAAKRGFELFHIHGDNDPSKPRPNVCGNCHRMPFWVSTNTPGTGMDAPTWRGAQDRFLILPQGRLNIVEFPFYRNVAERGQPEEDIWSFSWGGRPRFNAVWKMVLEGSTGYSGALGRQLTLDRETVAENLTKDLLDALELAAREQAVVLEVDCVFQDKPQGNPVTLQFTPHGENGSYVDTLGDRQAWSRDALLKQAAEGKFLGTFTARHGAHASIEHPQPAIWTLGPIEQQRGRQQFPILHADRPDMIISGRHLRENPRIFVDGRHVPGTVRLQKQEQVTVTLAELPPAGLHLLQLQNPSGLFSNDFLFHVVEDAKAATQLRRTLNEPHQDVDAALAAAIRQGDVTRLTRLLKRHPQRLHRRRAEAGDTLLSLAALHGQLDVMKVLVNQGAKIQQTNRDGNTPLHLAAFLCRREMVEYLLEQEASVHVKNMRNETAIDTVAAAWNDGLAEFYESLGQAVGIEIDLKQIEKDRPRIARRLREYRSDKNATGKNASGKKES